ncbi:MAG: exodeoxyribonuclease VII large subunit [Chlamydiae bacterium CG10_big_fil_rev_8_21_14_0_10_35_9]|nr:MAG: exodeoxyribonuclease VII large subunit [Chlamydiae bacterium CG10_big_fil_rev_8_21_14_0_10_35_9]
MQNLTTKKVFTVSELTDAIKFTLEPAFNNIEVQGEISNLKRQSSGHYYFSLKDKSSQISSVLFRGNSLKLQKPLKDGDQITAKGELSVYAPRGNYQLIIREIQHTGVGTLLLKLHELKEHLKQLGWLDKDLKKSLPKFPKKIGIITSPTGAVIQDILHVLGRRFLGCHLILNPVKVQGEGAKEEIAQAIDDFNRFNLVDVIIVGRGGGSLEDLWAFNEKIVAEAIYKSEIPIISAVGHETDYSISDLVADIRAPTPSAAAEIVIGEQEHILEYLQQAKQRLYGTFVPRVKHARQRLNDIQKYPVLSRGYALFATKLQSLDEMQEKYLSSIKYFFLHKKEQFRHVNQRLKAFNPILQLHQSKDRLFSYKKQLDLSIKTQMNKTKIVFDKNKYQSLALEKIQAVIKEKKIRLENLLQMFKAIDPKNLLSKGYSILFSEKDHSIILSSKNLKKNDSFYALTKDGKIYAQVKEIKSEGLDG